MALIVLGFFTVAPAAGQARSSLAPPAGVAIESNPQLFATLCALHAAGFEEDVSSAGFHPLRTQLRRELLQLNGPATQALRAYYAGHRIGDSAATLSRYVSFALVIGPPPEFHYVLRHAELPPDVLPIEGFNETLAGFYQEAQIDRLWARVQPAYEREAERLNESVAQIVLSSTGYLRELLRSDSPRTFSVYVEPMVGMKTNFRSYGNRYAIVLNPGSDLPVDEIRHAFLHFLLDPLAQRYPRPVAGKRPLLEAAARSPRLPVKYRDDFPAFLTECLIRAVELRLRRLPSEKLAAAVDEAEGNGYVLLRPFLRELVNFEKAGPAMSLYFPDLVRGIDVAEEVKRLERVKFAPAIFAPPEVEHAGDAERAAGAKKEEERELTSWLLEGERQIAAKDGAAATATFERALSKYPDHSRALYGLAVAQLLEGEPERAKQLFHRLITSASETAPSAPAKDPMILAWSHVYLGRIHDGAGDRELAVSEYHAALAVAGAPESALQAARRGLEQGRDRSARNPSGSERRPQ